MTLFYSHFAYFQQGLGNKEAQKVFIIYEYINEREPVQYLANFLRKHDQGSLANALEEFNKSEDLIPYVNDEFLPVRRALVLRSGGSCRFEMETSPRGFCLIILNELQLEPEAKQLTSVFSQMYFTVKVEKKKTCTQIQEILNAVANHIEYKGYNVLITIMIGHGEDGHFYGRHSKDRVSIPLLIDTFSEDQGVNFKNKPKVNIFINCRDSQ